MIDVILPVPLPQSFTYLAPKDSHPQVGSRVIVPFGKRRLIGIIENTNSSETPVKIRSIESILDEKPLIEKPWLDWLSFAAHYYWCPLGEVMSTAMPSDLFKIKKSLNPKKIKARKNPLDDHWDTPTSVTLNDQQQKILGELFNLTQSSKNETALIHGVTGSGKTEIYLKLAEHLVFDQKKDVIVLVPEIGLTPQMVARFKQVFGQTLGLYHSGLTENQRALEWQKAVNQEIKVMIGTRSALFTPFKNLGALIIDEEHDSSFKQEERFRYHARDLAVARGQFEKCLVVLGSATPSLESHVNAQNGKYHYLELPARVSGSQLPTIKLVDMAAQKRQTQSPLSLSRELFTAIENNLKKNEQTIILINRRGFASQAFCLACQKSITCPNCSVSLTYHKKYRGLLCHYCDYIIPIPKQCPLCQAMEITLLGLGTETIEDEIKTYFPLARVVRMDKDTTQKKGSLIQILKDLKDHKIDILIGTQMIAKGHDIPKVTLVGAIGLDAGLGLPDFRAGEKTFQLLMQVAGRAGRRDLPGQVIVQSYSPEHYAIQLACHNEYEKFAIAELKYRSELNYPPAGRLAQILFSSPDEKKLMVFINDLQKRIDGIHDPLITILGPSPAPLEKIRGKLRWHLLIKSPKVNGIQKALVTLTKIFDQMDQTGVKWAIDVDPVAML